MINRFQLVAPAGKASEGNLKLAAPSMKALGYKLKKDYFSYQPLPYLAASDEERARSLSEAWSSGEAVICLRGGYGCARLLDLLDWEQLRKTQSLLIGHSDISALHLAFLKHGLSRTVSGIMAAAEFTRDPDQELTLKSFDNCINQKPFTHSWKPSFVKQTENSVEGQLIPVTLSVLCSLLGTNHLPNFDGAILVLEDINEVPYKVDRMLNQLKQSKLFAKLSAIIMGDFNNCGSQDELNTIFADFASHFDFPIVSDLTFGHCLPRLNLPVGAKAQLDIKNQQATLHIKRY